MPTGKKLCRNATSRNRFGERVGKTFCELLVAELKELCELVRGEMQTQLFKRTVDAVAPRCRARVCRCQGKRGLTRLHLRGLRGAEEEFLLGAAFANLILLARSDDRPARPRQPHPPIERIDRLARISRGQFEQSFYATIS